MTDAPDPNGTKATVFKLGDRIRLKVDGDFPSWRGGERVEVQEVLEDHNGSKHTTFKSLDFPGRTYGFPGDMPEMWFDRID